MAPQKSVWDGLSVDVPVDEVEGMNAVRCLLFVATAQAMPTSRWLRGKTSAL